MLGGFLTVIGLFNFAFTSYSNVYWIGPIIGTAPFSAGILWIYTCVF